jgi:hypothetical protein
MPQWCGFWGVWEMRDHLFVGCAGDLYDTRVANWSSKPLRQVFSYHYPQFNGTALFKATLRAGAYTNLGGYPIYFICENGDTLHHSCARKHAKEHIREIREQDDSRIIGCAVNYEDNDLYCDHCNEPIESAYENARSIVGED